MWRSRWAAIGAAIAVALGAGGFGLAQAGIDSGERPVTVTIAPERILDTRVDLGLPGRFVNETPRDLQVTGDVPVASGGTATVVPSDAVAVLVNVTVVNPDSQGYLSLRPSGASGNPATSTVNFLPGSVEPNAATVDLGPGGKVQIFVKTAAQTGTADVLVDVVGYTVDHTHDDRYYTDEEVDALVGAVGPSPIVLGQGHHWVSNTANPSTVGIYEGGVDIDGGAGGTAHLALTSPITMSGSSYALTSITYCVVSDGGYVDEASIIGLGNLIVGDDLEHSAEVKDKTDRSGPGCYTIVSSPDVSARRSHHLMLYVVGTADIAEVTTTWTSVP